jgi:hypothetical protein
MDEKGFLIGMMQCTRRLVSKRFLKSKKCQGTSQPGNRENISILGCCNATGDSIPPGVIFRGESGDIMANWVNDFNPDEQLIHFASSPKGWTSNDLGVDWLVNIFLRYTRTVDEYRLLLLDGHNSHISPEFVDICKKNRVILGVFPPHTTHRLQPLDVGLFSPLSTAYSKHLEAWQRTNRYISFTKGDFLGIFTLAWNDSFTRNNIKKAWEATGIYPYNPERIISKIRIDSDWVDSDNESPVLEKPYQVREFCAKGPNPNPREQELSDAFLKAVTKLDIQDEEIQALRHAIKTVNKQTKQRKGLGMYKFLPEEDEGKPVFFSPIKIGQAQRRQAEEEVEKEQKVLRKEAAKLERAAAAAARKEAVQRRKEETAKRRLEAADEKALAQQLKEDQRKQRLAERMVAEAAKSKKKQSQAKSGPKRKQQAVNVVPEVLQEVVAVGRGGRITKRPARFRD